MSHGRRFRFLEDSGGFQEAADIKHPGTVHGLLPDIRILGPGAGTRFDAGVGISINTSIVAPRETQVD
jgi:hypothetical protein